MDRDYAVDETGEEFARENGVLFYEFGEVVQATCWISLVLWFFVIWMGLGEGLRFGVLGGRDGGGEVPMARVRKPKPRRTPA